MRPGLLLLALLAPLATAQYVPYTPTPEWTAVGDGTGQSWGHDVTSTGYDGRVTVIGAFEGPVQFGGSALATDGSGRDVFVVQYDTDGVPLWVRQIATAGRDVLPGGIASNNEDGIFVSGTFDGSAHFQGGESPDTTIASRGGRDAFLARYSADGDLVWAQTMGGPGDDRGYRVTADYDGVHVVGSFEATALWGLESITWVVTSAGGSDGFLARLTPEGRVESVLGFGGPGNDTAEGVDTNGGREVAVAGSFEDTAAFADTTFTSRGGSDAYALYLDEDGSLVDAIHVGGPGADFGRGVGVPYHFGDLGALILTGAFENTVQVENRTLVSAGGADVFIIGQSYYGRPRQAHVEAIRGGGPGHDEGLDLGFVEGFYGDIGAPSSVVTGVITGDVTFDWLGSDERSLAGFGGRDGFVISTTSYGFHALAALGGTSDDAGFGVSSSALYGDFGHGNLTGTFVEEAAIGTATVMGTLRPSVFVADFPEGELAPYSVAAEPSPFDDTSSLSVFPNPARHAATARLDLDAPADVTVEVLDVLGRRQSTIHRGALAAGETRLPVPLAGLAPGVYVVRVSGGAATARAFVVAR
ncbi:T9SS type A sorting domain-containing protein [Rubrivirga sp.]|uniref:T9SS type A sorting domain-containing protein n=1 Tax=Rubrivirga sp. TaxID=1885344 RepID=UPI003B520E35